MLQVKLLGGFSLTGEGASLAGILTSRSQVLLAYLILHRHVSQPRQRLASQLWSDSTDTQARTNLRKELSHLRRVLPSLDQLLLIDARSLQWQPSIPFTLDVTQFEEAIQSARTTPSLAQSALERALELHHSDLLPDCEDEWILPERDRIQQMYVRAVEQLIDLLKTQQDYQSALNYAQQLLRVDPLNESTYCTLMQLHGLSGDRANALQIYHRCMSVLREEFGVDPSLTTRKLYQLLLEDELPVDTPIQPIIRLHSLTPAPSRLPLVGRKQEWRVVEQWASASVGDAPSEMLLLVGEPGIGKTRLLEELRDIMPIALWGRGFAAELVRPYGIWIDALRSLELPPTVTLPPELGFLLPEIGQPVNAPPDRSHLFDAVVQLLAAWAQAPLVVMLDDIQWIDEASSALLHYAIRLLSHLPVRFACTARTGELEANVAVSRVMQALRRERRLQTLELHAFDREQTAELLSTVSSGYSAALSIERVDQVFIDSGGNPLFALELARASSQNQSAHTDDLEALINDRLQQLDSNAHDLLPWAAALGRSFKPTMVAQVADYPLPQLLMAIEQLEQQAVIRPSTSMGNEMGYDFAHDIVRQVIYRKISEPRRHLVHLRIAHKLNQCSTPDNALAGDIAHHAALGGDHELAAAAALLAAERCLKLFAYAEASTLAQRGIQHCQYLDKRTRIRLQLGLLRVTAIAGVTGDRAAQLEADAQQLMREASELGFKDDEAIGLEALWVLYFNQSNFTSIHQQLVQAVEVSRVASPATAARLLASSGTCLTEIGRDMVRAEALLLEAQSLAARVDLQVTDIYSGLGGVHFHNGRYAEARASLLQACKQAQVEQDHWRGCLYVSYLAMLELETGDPAAALPHCQEMAIVAAKIQGEGSEGAVAIALEALANYKLQQPGANAVLEQAVAALQQIDAKRMLAYVLIRAAEVDLASEQLTLAASRAEAALQAAQIMNHPSETALAWAILIQSVLRLGELERATTQFEALHRQIDRPTLSARARVAFDQTLQIMQEHKIHPNQEK
ncbi:MAG: AAA family ATPase [Oscillatoriophycideae cyanobacterium NC_groundwater_1537_Pr4_S-0.65um_50_18]|nr:AAA family ATPase [Oscillatoriophycideae cyanobacterium NC_groundwater_1537_Pr4_S-0.65um_50_18]